MNTSTIHQAADYLYPQGLGDFIDICIQEIFALCYSLFLLVCTFTFRNLQPLKSRTYLPGVAAVVSIVVTLFRFVTNVLCYTKAIADITGVVMISIAKSLTGVYLSLTVVQILQMTRFLLLQNASFQQIRLLSMSQSNKNAELKQAIKKIKVYSWLLSPAIPTALLILSAITLPMLYGLAFYLDFTTRQRYPVWVGLVAGVTYFGGCFIIVVISGIDALKNIKSTCPLHKHFISRDRLLFRAEAFFGIFAVAVWVIVEVIRASNSKKEVWFYVLTTILNLGRQFMFTSYVCGGIPLLSVLVTKTHALRHLQQRQTLAAPAADSEAKKEGAITSEGDDMLYFIKDTEGIKLMEEFVQAEYSIENLECWKLLQQIKSVEASKRNSLFNKFYDTFIKHGSPLQVNITAETRLIVDKLFESNLVSKPASLSLGTTPETSTPLGASPTLSTRSSMVQVSQPLDISKLGDLEASLLLNLRDSFIRIKQTHAYNLFLQGQKTKHEMLKKMNFV